MNERSIVETQAVALLQKLEREREIRTRRLREEATVQSRDIVQRARAEARARVRQAVAEARRESDVALARRRAAIDTGARRARQAALRSALEDAWRQLPAALVARWQDPSHRQAWCASACAQARQSLLCTERLVIGIDPGWRDVLAPLIEELLPSSDGTAVVEVRAVPGLGPGLTIRAGQACVDATVGGLLAGRERIAAALLAEIDGEARRREGQSP